MDPGQQQREIGGGPDRQPVFRLTGGHRKARVDGDHGSAVAYRIGKFLHLGVVHVFPEVAADQHDALGIANIGALRRADTFPEGEHVGFFPRPAALGIRRGGDIIGAIGLEQMFEEGAAGAVVKQGDAFRAVLLGDLFHLFGDIVERLVPAGFPEGLFATHVGADQGGAQALFVEVGPQAAGAAGTEPPVAVGIFGVAGDLPGLTVAGMHPAGAFPEADLANRRGSGNAAAGQRCCGIRRKQIAAEGFKQPAAKGQSSQSQSADFNKIPP